MSTYRGRCGSPWCPQIQRPPAARTSAIQAKMRPRVRLVVTEDIALLAVACVVREKWIRGVRIEAEHRTIPAPVFQDDDGSIVGAEEPKDPGGLAGGVVQDDRWSFALGGRIQSQFQTVPSRTVVEREHGSVVRGHRELRAYFAAGVYELNPVRGDDLRPARHRGICRRRRGSAMVKAGEQE